MADGLYLMGFPMRRETRAAGAMLLTEERGFTRGPRPTGSASATACTSSCATSAGKDVA